MTMKQVVVTVMSLPMQQSKFKSNLQLVINHKKDNRSNNNNINNDNNITNNKDNNNCKEK